MEDKKFLKYLLISWILCGALCVSGGPVLSATKSSLTQKLNQTNSKRNYFLQKKKQADLRLRSERNKLSNNQQKLEKAQSELRTTTQRYNALVSNLTTMERQLSAAVEEFKSIDAAMKARIRQVYKHQRTGMFELILSATDLNNLMDMFYFEKIVRNELKVYGSWNAISAPFPGREWTTTVHCMATGQLNVEPLITHRLPLSKGSEAFEMTAERKESFGKIMFYPEQK